MFTLKIAELCCNLHFVAPRHPPPLSIYVSACGVVKNYLKWQEIQLAMHCGESSLIELQML